MRDIAYECNNVSVIFLSSKCGGYLIKAYDGLVWFGLVFYAVKVIECVFEITIGKSLMICI